MGGGQEQGRGRAGAVQHCEKPARAVGRRFIACTHVQEACTSRARSPATSSALACGSALAAGGATTAAAGAGKTEPAAVVPAAPDAAAAAAFAAAAAAAAAAAVSAALAAAAVGVASGGSAVVTLASGGAVVTLAAAADARAAGITAIELGSGLHSSRVVPLRAVSRLRSEATLSSSSCMSLIPEASATLLSESPAFACTADARRAHTKCQHQVPLPHCCPRRAWSAVPMLLPSASHREVEAGPGPVGGV